jgi:hypothetical protein
MASNINETNINGNYPVAGQDNNSQGFRDNFSSIRNNLSIVGEEITDLQSKVVLKSALTGEELDNDLGGSVIKNAELRGSRETVVPLGTTAGTVNIDYANGSFFTLSSSGNITLEFSNPTPGDTLTSFVIQIVVSNTAHQLTIPASVTFGVDNIRGYDSNTITFDETGTYEFEFQTGNNGSNYSVKDLSRNTTDNIVFWSDSENLSSSAAASLETTVSHFDNDASETATLVAGTNGQIKVFAKTNDANDMVITVNDAGWKSSGTGTITFDSIGQACTLLYTNSKWYCIGNNGAAFA